MVLLMVLLELAPLLILEKDKISHGLDVLRKKEEVCILHWTFLLGLRKVIAVSHCKMDIFVAYNYL